MLKIDRETRVRLNFALKLADGQIIDSNFDTDPVTLEVGDGKLPAGFEKRLFGLAPGDQATFQIPSEDAFGPHREENIQAFRRDQFPHPDQLEKGLVLHFTDAANTELPGIVQAIDGDQVHIDFNHPLAGRNLIFAVKIHSVEPRIHH